MTLGLCFVRVSGPGYQVFRVHVAAVARTFERVFAG